jgi:hypothetical protein
MALAFSYHRGGLNEVEIWRLLTLATKINARELGRAGREERQGAKTGAARKAVRQPRSPMQSPGIDLHVT